MTDQKANRGAIATAEDANRPGVGRSTSEAALNEAKQRVARRNEEAQRAGRKLRAEREKRRLEIRRMWDGR